MMRGFLQDWPLPGLVISGWSSIVLIGNFFDDAHRLDKNDTQLLFLIFVTCIASTFFYRMGYRSQREEIDYWTNSALIQEPELTQRLYAQRFGEEVMKTRLECALSRRQERPPMYP